MHGPSSSTDEVKIMLSELINLNKRAHSYDPPPKKKLDEVPSEKTSASTPPPTNGLHIEKPMPDTIFHPPKSTHRKSVINPKTHATQYYNIV